MKNPNLKPIFRGIYLKFWHWQTDFENELTLSLDVFVFWLGRVAVCKIVLLHLLIWNLQNCYLDMKFLYHPHRLHISIFQLFYSDRPIYPLTLWSDQRQGYQATSIKFPVIGRFGSGASACVSWFFKLLHYHPSVNHSSKHKVQSTLKGWTFLITRVASTMFPSLSAPTRARLSRQTGLAIVSSLMSAWWRSKCWP